MDGKWYLVMSDNVTSEISFGYEPDYLIISKETYERILPQLIFKKTKITILFT